MSNTSSQKNHPLTLFGRHQSFQYNFLPNSYWTHVLFKFKNHRMTSKYHKFCNTKSRYHLDALNSYVESGSRWIQTARTIKYYFKQIIFWLIDKVYSQKIAIKIKLEMPKTNIKHIGKSNPKSCRESQLLRLHTPKNSTQFLINTSKNDHSWRNQNLDHLLPNFRYNKYFKINPSREHQKADYKQNIITLDRVELA